MVLSGGRRRGMAAAASGAFAVGLRSRRSRRGNVGRACVLAAVRHSPIVRVLLDIACDQLVACRLVGGPRVARREPVAPCESGRALLRCSNLEWARKTSRYHPGERAECATESRGPVTADDQRLRVCAASLLFISPPLAGPSFLDATRHPSLVRTSSAFRIIVRPTI